MILLDTNVISELMRPDPDDAVFRWIDAQPRETLFTTTIVQAEIFYGIACLPEGQRKDILADQAKAIFEEDLKGRVLPLTQAAAIAYAQVAADRRGAGKPIGQFDALIAAVAHTNEATVATRDVAGFEGCGVDIVDPWEQ
ncbi:MAG: type II toxin-antitoxin system VapC family toxin [Pseudomonadota bacterium]